MLQRCWCVRCWCVSTWILCGLAERADGPFRIWMVRSSRRWGRCLWFSLPERNLNSYLASRETRSTIHACWIRFMDKGGTFAPFIWMLIFSLDRGLSMHIEILQFRCTNFRPCELPEGVRFIPKSKSQIIRFWQNNWFFFKIRTLVYFSHFQTNVQKVNLVVYKSRFKYLGNISK